MASGHAHPHHDHDHDHGAEHGHAPGDGQRTHAGHGHEGHVHADHDHQHSGDGHAHGLGHHHAHAPAGFDRAFAIGIVLNAGFVAIEAGYGWKVDSLALLADAGHNLSDVAGLLLAWGGAWAGKRRPDARYTYGYKRASVLAAFANAVLLLIAMGSLAWEAVGRLQTPAPQHGLTVMVVAAVGIAVNAATALLFMRGAHGDLNIRGAYLHMVSDALVSAGVVVAGALTLWLGWDWLDPVASLAIAAIIVVGTWGLLRQSTRLLFDGVPEHIELDAVRGYLESLQGVDRVHDLHVWASGTSDSVLTAQLVMPAGHPDDAFLAAATQHLQRRFRIGHITLQTMRVPYTAACAASAPEHGHAH